MPIRTLSYGILACTLTVTVWAIAYWAVLQERERRSVVSAEQAKRLAVFFERDYLSRRRAAEQRRQTAQGGLSERQKALQGSRNACSLRSVNEQRKPLCNDELRRQRAKIRVVDPERAVI